MNWVALILLVTYHANVANGDIHTMLRRLDEEENDPEISLLEKNKLNEYRTVLIKQEILKMLGLKSAPNVTAAPAIPRQMLHGILRQSNVPPHQDTKQVIVLAEPGMRSLP